VLGAAVIISLTTVVLVLALIKSSELVLIVDPGEVVRSGYTISRFISTTAGSISLGSLIVIAFMTAARSAAVPRLFTLSGISAAVWAVTSMAASVFTFSNISGVPLQLSDGFVSTFAYYATAIPLGQAWTALIVAASIIAIGCLFATTAPHALALAGVAVLALIPLAQQGHASSSTAHFTAVSSILMHIVFASLWVGTLIALFWTRRHTSDAAENTLMSRYSTLAFVCFLAVALSGLVSASLRISTPEQLFATAYGPILLAKVAVFLLLGAAGFAHRRWLLRRLGTSRARLFWSVVATEIVLMGVAFALAAVLARTAPPGSEAEITDIGPVTEAEALTGTAFPGAVTIHAALLTWRIDPAWTFLLILLAAAYLGGARRMKATGSPWPAGRTIRFGLALGLFAWLTNGAPTLFATYTLGAYTQLLVAATAAASLAASGRPLLLASLVVRGRSDGTWGVREHTSAILTRGRMFTERPVVMASIFAVTIPVSFLPAVTLWGVSDPIGRGTLLAVWTLTTLTLVESLLATRRTPGAVQVVTAVLPLLGTALAMGITVGPTIAADWFETINPGGTAAAAASQSNATSTLIVLAATWITVAVLCWLQPQPPSPSAPAGRVIPSGNDVGDVTAPDSTHPHHNP
jgi:putative copper export protein